MIVTSNQLLQNILESINTALLDPNLHNDVRTSLIDQYERTITLIRDGYQFSEIDLLDLPTKINNETIALLSEHTSAFENLVTTFNAELLILSNHNLTIEDSNTVLATVVNKSSQIQNDLSTFQIYLNTLAQIKEEIQLFQNQINSYVIPTNVTYSPTTIDDHVRMSQILNLIGA